MKINILESKSRSFSNSMNTVGFTTTVPLEILIAAQKTPVDLNNIFISGFPTKGSSQKGGD